MDTIKALVAPLIVLLCLASPSLNAQSVPIDAIQKELSQLYQTAKVTADGADIVTAGAVLVLQKDHLMMSAVEQPILLPNTYKGGTITQNGLVAVGNFFKALSKLNPNDPNAQAATTGVNATREFVAGEKFWVARIDTRSDGVTFALISDPIKDIRYHCTLKFPFPKGTAPSPDDAAALIAEVIKIDGADAPAQEAAAPAAAPPPVATKTIALGQTRDQVVAMFGVPTKVVQLGAKEIDFFPDMKVTFVQNKVVDVK